MSEAARRLTQLTARQPLGRLRVPISRKPMKLKTWDQTTHKLNLGRLESLRRLITQLVREERIEIPRHRAFEARQYAERLLQMAIVYGPSDEHMMEMANWWLTEKELVPKLFKVLVPRFHKETDDISRYEQETTYTRVFHLSQTFLPEEYKTKFIPLPMSILELKGNPFPPVVPKPPDHRNSLLNILVAEARKADQISKVEAEMKMKAKLEPPADTTSNDTEISNSEQNFETASLDETNVVEESPADTTKEKA